MMFKRDETKSDVHLISRVVKTLIAIGSLVFALVGWAWLKDGTSEAIRAAAALAMPLGFLWFCTLTASAWQFFGGRRLSGLLLLCLAVLLSAALNERVVNRVVSMVESPPSESADRLLEQEIHEPFDAVIVLGGCVQDSPDGHHEITRDGERIFTAVQFFQNDLTSNIIVTGSSVTTSNPRDQAYELLQTVGIPAEAIIRTEGVNTVAEMQTLKTFFDRRTDLQKVGLITSAFHLPRAMDLAELNGLSFIPLPGAYRCVDASSFRWYRIVPDVRGLESLTVAVKEMIARSLGR